MCSVTIGVVLAAALQAQAPPQKATGQPGTEGRRQAGASDAAKAPAESQSAASTGQKQAGSASSKDGKTYVQHQTPFGTAKYEAKPEEKAVEEAPSDVRAYDQGDTVRFEKKTPFGVSRWTRKKSELDASERAILAREQAGKAAPPVKQ
jgi:hypothetical protein